MLNIVSKSIYQKHPSGPKKLIDNLLKGFDQLNVSYVLNKNPIDCKYTWIHDDPDAISYICKNIIPEGNQLIFGPNIFFQPEQIASNIGDIKIENSNLIKGKYIMPSVWVEDYWKNHGYTAESVIWPVGIDTEYFSPVVHGKLDKDGKHLRENKVLLYTKGRNEKDVQIIIDFLNSNDVQFTHIKYGKHSEPELMSAGVNCKFGIIIDSSESQGIAIQELLSLNLPLIIFNIDYLNQDSYENSRYFVGNSISREHATSVPYFDDRCGKIGKTPEEVKGLVSEFISNKNLQSQYSPRQFVEENLSLKGQALKFLENINYPYPVAEKGLNSDKILEDNKNNKPTINARNWKNRTWFKPVLLAKFFIKYLRFKFS